MNIGSSAAKITFSLTSILILSKSSEVFILNNSLGFSPAYFHTPEKSYLTSNGK